MNWIIEQQWKHVIFFHWRIPAATLRNLVPFELDLFEGEAVISIVPFRMERVRFPYLPHVPFISSLWELNLRTYVRVNGIPGIYFFTLDTDNFLAQWVANKFFRLPYRMAKMEGSVSETKIDFASARPNYDFECSVRPLDGSPKTSDFDRWATERYSLFVEAAGKRFQGIVRHEPWNLVEVETLKFESNFSDQFGIVLPDPCYSAAYCPQLNVRFQPFKRIG